MLARDKGRGTETNALSSFELLPIATAKVYRTAGGTTYIWHAPPGIFVTRIEGLASEETLTAIEVGARRIAAGGHTIESFHDWWEITDYVPQTRERMTTLRRDLDHMTRGSNILLRSKVVAFGVRTASLMVRNVTVFSERQPFEHALREAIRRQAIGASR